MGCLSCPEQISRILKQEITIQISFWIEKWQQMHACLLFTESWQIQSSAICSTCHFVYCSSISVHISAHNVLFTEDSHQKINC